MGKMLSSALSAAFLLHICLVHAVAADLLSAHRFFASLDEDQSVKLYWNVTTTNKEIFFTVEAKTTGWIGFGISSGQGKMQGADIVIGWVKDGVPYFQVHVRQFLNVINRQEDRFIMSKIHEIHVYRSISIKHRLIIDPYNNHFSVDSIAQRMEHCTDIAEVRV